MALKENAIDEVIVKGNNVIFKAIGSAEWFFSNASMLSKDQLFKIIAQNPGLKISCIEDRSAEMSQLMLCIFFQNSCKKINSVRIWIGYVQSP